MELRAGWLFYGLGVPNYVSAQNDVLMGLTPKYGTPRLVMYLYCAIADSHVYSNNASCCGETSKKLP